MAKLSDFEEFYAKKKKDKKVNPHAGHRNRLKERFLKEGSLENFELHNILEILLFFGVPQKDTNEIAHTLIKTFGSFSEVFKADVKKLATVKGMTRNAAVLIKLIPEIYRRYIVENSKEGEFLNDSDKIKKILIPKFMGRNEEIVYLFCLDNSCKLLREEIVAKGNRCVTHIDLRKITEIVFECGADSIILAHNHPTGGAEPSFYDKNTTERLQRVLAQLDIEFLDHFIVSDNNVVSMMELGYLGVKSIVEVPYIPCDDF